MTSQYENPDARREQAPATGIDEPAVAATAPAQAVSNQATLDGQSGRPMFERLGGIVRLLHDSMRELGYDRSLSQAAAQISDAQGRLEYVAALTEKAANKVLNAIDIGMPEQETLARQAREINQRWALHFENRLDQDQFKELARDSQQFSEATARCADAEKARLLEIMMAQDFQDITGQLIKKIMAITQLVETEMAQLLRDYAPPELRAAQAEEHAMSGTLTAGPSLPAAALAQDSVDDLLDSLGF
jgi:chemotaxis protein CheZ